MDKRFTRSAWRVLPAAVVCLSLLIIPRARASAGTFPEVGTTNRAILGNDDIDTPLVIGSLPFTTSVDTSGATSAVDDPAFTVCSRAAGYATVWFAITPATNGSLVVDTMGSSYNTVLGVWTGTRGALGTLGCNDDAGGTLQSRVVASLTAGTTYFIEVAEYSGMLDQAPLEAVGGTLNLNVRWMSRLTLRSVGAYDGWILEMTEESSQGLTLNNISEVLMLGDETWDRQYRAILSFDTGRLPDNAVITLVQLKIRRPGTGGIVGGNPFKSLGRIAVDMRKPWFGVDQNLRAGDFQAVADRKAATLFNAQAVDGWYSTIINYLGYPFVNLTGPTQFRLRFQIGDNDNGVADYMKFYSGNYATVTSRPTLIIEYFVP